VATALRVAKITVAAKVIGSASKFRQRGFHWQQLEGSQQLASRPVGPRLDPNGVDCCS
jgi:hypothetical protein